MFTSVDFCIASDAIAEIRAVCIKEMGMWMKLYNAIHHVCLLWFITWIIKYCVVWFNPLLVCVCSVTRASWGTAEVPYCAAGPLSWQRARRTTGALHQSLQGEPAAASVKRLVTHHSSLQTACLVASFWANNQESKQNVHFTVAMLQQRSWPLSPKQAQKPLQIYAWKSC